MRLRILSKFILFLCSFILLRVIWPKLDTLLQESICQTTKSSIHSPLSVLYPMQIKQKAFISIGIICRPDERFIENVRSSLLSITRELKQIPRSKKYKIIIGVLGYSKTNLIKVETLIKLSHIDLENVETFMLSYEDVNIFLTSVDMNFAINQNLHAGVIQRRAETNILLSLLMYKCSQHGKFTLITDSKIQLQKDSMVELSKCFRMFEENKELEEVKLYKSAIIGTLFRSDKLKLLNELLYRTSLQVSLEIEALHFEVCSSKAVKTKPDKPLFQLISQPVSLNTDNPKAYISSNTTVWQNYYPQKPYESSEIFWGPYASKDSWIKIKFYNPVRINHILIETGKDIYFSDIITKAILEESFYTDNSGDCKQFVYLTDFRNAKVDINLEKRDERKTTCLRIRFIEDVKEWVAINRIKIST